jgi:type 2 lantibiotic biosynthesis protein LanM
MGPLSCRDAILASRSANLDERLRTLEAFQRLGVKPANSDALSSVDLWRISKHAKWLNQLGDSLPKDLWPRIHVQGNFASALALYQRYEASISVMSTEERSVYKDIHGWLAHYIEAMKELETGAKRPLLEVSTNSEILYSRMAKIAEPFLLLISRRTDLLIANRANDISFSDEVCRSITRRMVDKFEIAWTWAMEVEVNLYREAQKGTEEFPSNWDRRVFLDSKFTSPDDYRKFYSTYPLLARWLTVFALQATAGLEETIDRLIADSRDIAQVFFGGVDLCIVQDIKTGLSDPHNSGRTVAKVSATLVDGQNVSFLYKPRSVKPESAYQTIFGVVARETAVDACPYSVLDRDKYGWVEAVSLSSNSVGRTEEAASVYRQLGTHLALIYLLGGGDMHLENIAVAHGLAHILDCETILGVIPELSGIQPETLIDSVFRTGMLDWPRGPDDNSGMRVSGYSSDETYNIPVAVPIVRGNPLTLDFTVQLVANMEVSTHAANRVYLSGNIVEPSEFVEEIVSGFQNAYRWLSCNRVVASDLARTLFADTECRFLNRGTQAYALLQSAALHPKCLSDPLRAEEIFSVILERATRWDANLGVAKAEVEALWNLDIPYFSVSVSSNILLVDKLSTEVVKLIASPISRAIQRIKSANQANLSAQVQYIRSSLLQVDYLDGSLQETTLQRADRIGEHLAGMVLSESSSAPWTTYDLGGNLGAVDIGKDLYSGSSGICLFLAYLNYLKPSERKNEALRQAEEHACFSQQSHSIGAFQGLAGTIYVLVHLYFLSNQSRYLERAVCLASGIKERIASDTTLDLLGGVAGVIPVMLALAEAGHLEAIDTAVSCAEHLLECATLSQSGLSWSAASQSGGPNLTGFAHGAGGIGWSLFQLGAFIDERRYLNAGKAAFSYEDEHFDNAHQDWYDLRQLDRRTVRKDRHFGNAWCNGCAGIGMARLSSWLATGKSDHDLLRSAEIAVAATLRGFPKLKNESLCHGRSGNSELLLRFGHTTGRRALTVEAFVRAQEHWARYDDIGRWSYGEDRLRVFPGMMLGMAGFGLHFLRLAFPDLVPSPLLLDRPARRPVG